MRSYFVKEPNPSVDLREELERLTKLAKPDDLSRE